MDMFCLGIDYDNVGTEFGNDDVGRKGATGGGKARHIGEDLGVLWIWANGVFKIFQKMVKNRVVAPGKSALVEGYWTMIENMVKSFSVTAQFTVSLQINLQIYLQIDSGIPFLSSVWLRATININIGFPGQFQQKIIQFH